MVATPAKNEIEYYLIENPFKEEKKVVYNLDKILETLKHFKEDMKVKRTFHVHQKEEGQKDQVLAVEKSLVENYEEGSDRLRSWAVFYPLVGLALSYLLFQPLFRMGYLPLISFLTRNFKSITLEIINAYVDPGGLLAALAIGMALGFSPLILGLLVGFNAWKRARRDKEHAQLVRALKGCGLEIVENEHLASFHKNSQELIGETREQGEKLREAKEEYTKIETCERIEVCLEKLTTTTKFLGLSGVNEHYHKLHDSFYELEKRLRKPRFWRNDNNYLKELLDGLI